MSRNAASDLPLSSPVNSNAPQKPVRLPLTATMVLGIVGLFLFLTSQILVFAGAIVWAIGTTLHLALTGFSVLGAAAAGPVGWLCWKILAMAIDAERDPANN